MHVSRPATGARVSRRGLGLPWSGVASLLSCPSVRVHAHGQLPRAPTTACILCAANIAADNADMFSSRIAVVVVLAVASTGSAFQNEGETNEDDEWRLWILWGWWCFEGG